MEDTELRRQLETCHRQSFSWALQCCGHDRSRADDVLQIAYLKVLDGRARFDARSSFITWLFAVIRRTAADEWRRHVLRLTRHSPLRDDVPLDARETGGTGDIEASERRALLRRALGELPRRQREVMLLVFYHERTVEEAALILGVGVGSARTHYARAKERLREVLRNSEVRDEA